jgi:hypothetical protein
MQGFTKIHLELLLIEYCNFYRNRLTYFSVLKAKCVLNTEPAPSV